MVPFPCRESEEQVESFPKNPKKRKNSQEPRHHSPRKGIGLRNQESSGYIWGKISSADLNKTKRNLHACGLESVFKKTVFLLQHLT